MAKLVGFGVAKPWAEAKRHAIAILENFMVVVKLFGRQLDRPLG
jgi:hypothetical protein